MASAQWNRAQQSTYRGGYEQQTPSYITGPRSPLIRCSSGSATAPSSIFIDTCCSDNFFGNAKSKSLGLYVIVPEGYQCACFLSCVSPRVASAKCLLRSYALEKLGKYFRMLEAGMHILVPFIDEITFTRCLKTGLLDCPPQVRRGRHLCSCYCQIFVAPAFCLRLVFHRK
jgi:hypothetical protein